MLRARSVAFLLDLIRKRHNDPSWVVITEVSDGTGASAHRRADALAIGLWPSRGFEIHGYETKLSRGDVQKELKDPRKADAVGKFCDFWWLVVSDLAIIDGLVLPSTWGVLSPKNGVLRVHVKAPKQKVTPVNRSFAASVIRNVMKSWVPKSVHDQFKANARELARVEIERERAHRKEDQLYDLEQLRAKLVKFKEESGIDLEKPVLWQIGDIAKAVNIVMEGREAAGVAGNQHWRPSDPIHMVRQEAFGLEQAAKRHDVAAAGMRAAKTQVDQLIERLKHEDQDRADLGSRSTS